MSNIAQWRLNQGNPKIAFEGPRLPPGRGTALIGILLVAFSARQAVSAVSPVLSTMGGDLPFSAASIGILGMLPTAGFAFMGFLALPLIRRFQMEHLLLIAILLTFFGQLGRSMGTTVTAFLILTLMATIGMGLGNIVMPPLLMKYFPDKAGIIASLFVMLLGVSTALASQFAIPLAGYFGWRFSIGIWSALSAVAAVPWIVLLARGQTTTRIKSVPFGGKPSTAPQGIKPWKSSIGWGVALIFAGCSSNTYATITWLPAVLVDRGLSLESGGSMIALFTIVGLPTGLFVPLIVAKVRRPLPLAVFFAAMFAAGYSGILFAPAADVAVWVTIAGLGQGTYSFAFTMINKRTRTSVGSGNLSGFAQGVGYALACLGPLLFGLLHHPGDSWIPSFGMLGGWLLALTAGAIMINRPRMLEDALSERDG